MQNKEEIADEKNTAEYNALIESSHPQIYQQNAFRILELPVTATPRDIKKRRQIIEMARKTGMAVPPGPAPYLPLDPPPDEGAVRQAAQRLQDPERRLVDELFWFWPDTAEKGKTDQGLCALGRGDLESAQKHWHKTTKGKTNGFVPLHNMAVWTHLSALEDQNSTGNGLWKTT